MRSVEQMLERLDRVVTSLRGRARKVENHGWNWNDDAQRAANSVKAEIIREVASALESAFADLDLNEDSQLTVTPGEVVAFDRGSAFGRVQLAENGSMFEFHSTTFRSSLPTRFPRVGDAVNVTFSNGRIVSVRSE
jgi:hypothetical protein